MRRRLHCLAVWLLLAIAVYGQAPVADFTNAPATPTTGCLGAGGFVVNFQDLSTNTPTTWAWDFGDPASGASNISANKNPFHIYNTAGVYTVKLTATNASGGNTQTKAAFITVFAPPVVAFTANKTTGCFPLAVSFTDQSTAGSGSISSWTWDFGDGSGSAIQNPSNIYKVSGNIPVNLTVKNSNGCSASLQKAGYIVIPNGVKPDFSSSTNASNCAIPITVNFANATSGGAPNITYNWDFGDGGTSTTTSPAHPYGAVGAYSVKLVAQSSAGCKDSIIKPVSISNPGNNISSFTSIDSVCTGVAVTFQNTSTPNPNTSNWDFGDGTTSSQYSAIKTFTTAGTYTVTLTNTFGVCVGSISKTIKVFAGAGAKYNVSDSGSCKVPHTINFTDASNGAVTWLWNFGDGGTSTAKNPSHTYNGFGKFTVTLIVTNGGGCSDTLIKKSFIQMGKPTLHVSSLPGYGCIPFTFTAVTKDTVPDGVASYLWDFGDGTTSTAALPTHNYNVQGKYVVKYTVVTKGGCTQTLTDTVKVGTTKPTAAFSLSPNPVCPAPAVVTFTDQSTNSPNQWLWDFGDQNQSTLQNPTHAYNTNGNFTVTMTAYNNGCFDVTTKVITVLLPIAKFSHSIVNCANKTQFSFKDLSSGAATWSWNFGDGSPVVTGIASPTHTFPATVNKVYYISLTVTNANGCLNTKTDSIKVVDEKSDFTTNPSTVCKNGTIFFSAVNLNIKNITAYFWDYGETKGGGGSPTGHVYHNAGTFNVGLRITDINGCTDSTAVPKTVRVNGPTAGFTTTNTTGCKGLSPVFTDQSTSDGVNNIVQWIWDYGDGTVQTYSAPPFNHAYVSPGIFNVKLKVVDASGCMDSVTKNNLVTVSIPKADFSSVDSFTCPGSPVMFINNSSGNGLTYNWTFGDGGTSTSQNPAYTYNAVGVNTVVLNIKDQFGCTDIATKTNYITVDIPLADFTVNQTSSTCPPLNSVFTYAGHYEKTVHWDFGDGGSSNLLSPTHTYTIPGNYTATLTVTSSGGCTSTKSVPISVSGPYGSLSYAPLLGCDTLTITINATTSGNVTQFIWDFNNGQTQTTTVPSITYQYPAPGSYIPQVVLHDNTGCNVLITGSETVLVVGTTPKFGYDRSVFCGSGPVQFSDSTTTNGVIASWDWDFGDGGTSTTQNPLHNYTTPGFYTVQLIVTTQNGCKDTLIKNNLIHVVDKPNVDINGVNSSCVPVSLTVSGVLVVPDPSPLTWSWNFFNGNTATGQNPAPQTYPVAGSDSVQLIAINSFGCPDTVTKYFTVYPLPVTNAGPDAEICLGQNTNLLASGAATYDWLAPSNSSLSCTNCAAPVATPAVTTSYIVQGTTAFGCTANDTVIVTVNQPITVSIAGSDSVCRGRFTQLNATGAATYVWSPSAGLSDPASASPTASPDTTTTYQVIGYDGKSCFTDTQYVKISVFDFPTLDLGADVTIPVGTTYQVNGTGSPDITNITWSPLTGFKGCTNCLTPVLGPSSTTTYIATATNNGGCSVSDSIRIIVACNTNSYFIPNTFSPNGDNVNDQFYIQGRGLNTISYLRIFNRWGQVVFEKRNFPANTPSAGWDGTFNGKPAPADVYVYTLEIVCDNGVIFPIHGNLALIR